MQLVVNALIAGSFAALVAGGLSLVYGVLGVFNLALGQMVLLGGYATWWLHVEAGLPLAWSILGGLGAGALSAALIYEIAVAPFAQRHRFLPLVTTIAASMILDGLILLVFEERTRRIIEGVPDTFTLVGARVSGEQATLVFATLLILISLAGILHATPLGRKIRAVVQHPHAALSLGIPAPLLKRLVFAGSGVLAAAGGIFLGLDQNLTPTLAFPITIKAYAAIIAGGKGNLWGAILCAYMIALLEQLLVGITWFGRFTVPAGYQSTIALLFIIGFLILKPTGLLATRSRTA